MILVNKHKLIKFTKIDISDILTKWEKIGLLIGIDREDKLQLALYLEELLNYLITIEKEMSFNSSFEPCIFAVLRRIYVMNIGRRINIRSLANDFKEYSESVYYRRKIEMYKNDRHIDIEGELVADYANGYKL